MVQVLLQPTHSSYQLVGVVGGHHPATLLKGRAKTLMSYALFHIAANGLCPFSGGSCCRMPTVVPVARKASPLFGLSKPAMIRKTLIYWAPLGPTTPILAPGYQRHVVEDRRRAPCGPSPCR